MREDTPVLSWMKSDEVPYGAEAKARSGGNVCTGTGRKDSRARTLLYDNDTSVKGSETGEMPM